MQIRFSDFLKHTPARALVLGVSVASVAFLVFALVAQYGFNLHPCELCMAQRYPYAAIALIGLSSALWVKDERTLWRIALLCAFLFVVDAGIAAYHAGVESGVFPGPSACTSNDKPGESLEDMRRAIMSAALVSCDQPMAKFLGLSMAAWNAIAAAVLALFTLVIFRRGRILK